MIRTEGAGEYWSPIVSAESATTFAAFLAAIVLAAIVQISITNTRADGSGWRLSLHFSTVALVVLLTTTYMFVLLSGLQTMTEEPMAVAIIVQRASILFGVAGSVLAVGAVCTLALLVLIFREGGQHKPIQVGASTTLIMGAVTAALFLLFGYDDIYQTFTLGADFKWYLWVIQGGLLLAPILAGALLHQPFKTAVDWLGRRPQGQNNTKVRAGALLAGIWLYLVPALAFLLLSHTTNPTSSRFAAVVTSVCALWAGLSMAGVVVFCRDYGDEAPEQRSTQPTTAPDEHSVDGGGHNDAC